MVPQESSHLSRVKGQPETELCDQFCWSQWDLGEEDKWQHQDEDLLGPASARALCDPPEVSGLTFYSVLPLTPFLEWFLALFCFLLHRKFLTWEMLLGLGKWTLLWIPRGTFVAGHSLPLCYSSPASILFSRQLAWDYFIRSIGSLLYLLLCCLIILCLIFFFKPPLSLFKASFEFEETTLLVTCRSFYHEQAQEVIHSTVHFWVLNLISGSHSYLPCQAQFTVSSEAWGRGPSRGRLILLALSLLGEINTLCNIWRMPSIPLAERQTFAWETMRIAVYGVGGRGHFLFIKCWRCYILNVVQCRWYIQAHLLYLKLEQEVVISVLTCNSLLSPIPK